LLHFELTDVAEHGVSWFEVWQYTVVSWNFERRTCSRNLRNPICLV